MRTRHLSSHLFPWIASIGVCGAVPAFPGAEGFGANAKGARASTTPTVHHVTNLNDSGTGSLRDAVSASNRIIVFDVGGIIRIKTPLVFSSGLTIAGQSAPGEGVTVYGNRVSFSGAHNTICRYMRFRMGIDGDDGADAMGIANGSDMIFDHVSASWGRDETFSISGDSAIRITLQDCLIAQGLRIHSAGGLMQTSGGVSIFRTLYADNWMRNPKIKGVNDFINNVVYNWGGGGGYIPAGDSAGDSFCNLIGCYFIGGPETGVGTSPFKSGNTNYRLYHTGNLQDLDLDGVLDGTSVTNSSFPTLQLVGTRFNHPAPTTELSANAALTWVLDHAGASHHRDRTDDYVVTETHSYGASGAFIYDEADMGGIGTLDPGLKPADTDNDGMPDWWEEAAGTNPTTANATLLGSDGYLNIERYLNAIVTSGVPGASITGISNDTGSSLSDGVTSDQTLVLSGDAPAGASVAIHRADIGLLDTVTADGSGIWTYPYTGTTLADRHYAFTATSTSGGVTTPPCKAFIVRVDTVAAPAPVISAISLSPALSIQGTAAPEDSLVVFLTGSPVGTATADALGNWSASYTGAPLAAGTHSFTASATDLAGNPGPASAVYLVNTAISPPVFNAISTDSGSSSSDQLTNDTTLTLSGTAPASSTVSVTRAGVGVVGTATATSGGTFSFNYTTTLPAGSHVFTATASQGGVASPSSATFTVTVDTSAPAISSISRHAPSIYSTNGGSVVFRVTFAEPVTGVGLSDFTLTKSGTTGSLSSIATVSSTIHDVTATGVSGDGTARLDLNSSGTGIADLAGNTISGGYTSGQTYTIRLTGSGVWTNSDDAGLWSEAANWQDSLIASGTGTTADFSLSDLTEDTSLILDSSRTVQRLVFGDSDYETPASWTVSDGGNSGRTITLSGSSTPTIQVNGLTTPAGDTTDVPEANAWPHHLAATLTGSAGFTKTGVGTIELNRPNPGLNGALTISKGIVQIGPGGSLAPSSVTISTSQQLRVTGGSFSTAGNVSWTSGTGTGVIVSGGTADFQNIVPSNVRNSFFKVTGGTITGNDMNFPRSGDSEGQTVGTGVLISGGDTTFANIGLGTNNSWAGMTISGGKLTVTGTLHNGYQASAGRGGVIYLQGGELAVTGTTNGLVMSRKSGSNADNVSKLLITGGTANLAKLTLGYDSTVNDGTATVSVSSGQLNLNTGGIVKNGTSGLVSSITLSGGTLGALGTWDTSHPILLSGTPNNLFIRAGDPSGAPHDITLNGALTGSGGFSKTGGGTLVLSGPNTFTGDITVQSGTLALTGSLAAGGELSVQSAATLAGNGVSSKPVTLANGGIVSPSGTLTLASLMWIAGGHLAIDLGAAGEALALDGAFTRSGSGAFTFDFLSRSLPLATPVTLVSFSGSTNFNASDFTFTGLGSATGHFTLTANSLLFTIDSEGPPSDPFLAWLAANGIDPSPGEAGNDPDHDGTNNLMEFVLGTEPDAAGASGVIALTTTSGGQHYPAIRFTRRIDRGGVLVTVQSSETPDFTLTNATIEVSASPLGNGIEEVIARSTIPITASTRQFLRVKAVLP